MHLHTPVRPVPLTGQTGPGRSSASSTFFDVPRDLALVCVDQKSVNTLHHVTKNNRLVQICWPNDQDWYTCCRLMLPSDLHVDVLDS
jgi:hypothetical protein